MQMATKSLYVGNISYSATPEDLKSLFASWGPVSEARIIPGRGFGFVDLPAENAAAAIVEFNGTNHMGRTITVSEAKAKAEGGNRW